MHAFIKALPLCLLLLAPGAGSAQQVAFSGLRADTSAPVQITADALQVDQKGGQAVFTGNVVAVQGDMRLKAATLQVEYAQGSRSKIERLHASGGVTLASPTEAAESAEAVYQPSSGNLVMTGNVLMTQGQNVMSGQKLVVDMRTGIGQMDGRVRTILQPGTP